MKKKAKCMCALSPAIFVDIESSHTAYCQSTIDRSLAHADYCVK